MTTPLPHFPYWPNDLFDHIVEFCGERELCTLSRVNKILSEVALRALYGSIILDQRPANLRQDHDSLSSLHSPPPTQKCLETLKSNDYLASLVRSMNIQWQRQTTAEAPSMSTDKYGGLLKVCLMRCVNLQDLVLNFNIFETFPALNDTFSFQLVRFSTTLPWNEDLIAFLGSQSSSLQELGLHGDGEGNVIPLQNKVLPAIRVLHWGGNAKVEVLSTILKKTWHDLESLHVIFIDIKATEDVVDLLRQYPTVPLKLCFAFHVRGALGCVSGLPIEKLFLGGPCVISSPEDLTVRDLFWSRSMQLTELL